MGALSADAQSPATFTTIGQITPGAPMNWFNPNGLAWLGLDIMPLAWTQNTSNPNAFWPAIAVKWQASDGGKTVTVWLRKGARWSDGQPITAQDVVTTAALEFASGWIYWNLGSVKALGPYEVQFKMAPGVQYNLFENQVLNQAVLPAQVYGKLLPANIWQLIDESMYNGTDKAKLALAKTASGKLTAIGTKISAFAPKTDVSSGPFVVSGINPGEAVLNKDNTYWGAKGISVDQVVIRNYTSNQGIWNYMIGGQVDQSTSAMPTSIKERAMQTPGNQFYTVPSYYANSLLFNEKDYPYNILRVRQALAYLINRNAVQEVGEPVSGSQVKWIDGLTDTQTKDSLTPAQIAKLNPYTYNPTKAAELLTLAGFKKVNGQWMMPNGKPWKASIAVNASYTDWVQGASVVSNELTTFGVPTTAQLVPAAQFATEQGKGQFPLSFWTIALGPEDYYAFNRLYGTVDGYSLTGGAIAYNADPTKGNFVQFPQTVSIPGYGSVQAGPLTIALEQTNDQALYNEDVAKLALLTNEYVPAITTWDGLQAGFINTNRFTDFPTNHPNIMLAGVYYPPVGFWMDMGFIKPKN